MKNIIVPTDFSEDAEKAYPLAKKIAKSLGASIKIFTVLPSYSGEIALFAGGANPNRRDPDLRKSEDEKAKSQLEALKSSPDFTGLNIETIALEDNGNGIVPSVLEFINHEDHEYVIMGTAGDENDGESNAAVIARKSAKPLITVKSAKKADADIKKILLPTDFKTIHAAFIGYVQTIAKAFDAEIEILHINTPKNFYETEELDKEWSRFQRRMKLDGSIKMKTVNARKIEDTIQRYAHAKGFDMIALPTHGRTGFNRFFNDSYTEDIINESDLPILSYNMHNDYQPYNLVTRNSIMTRGFSG